MAVAVAVDAACVLHLPSSTKVLYAKAGETLTYDHTIAKDELHASK